MKRLLAWLCALTLLMTAFAATASTATAATAQTWDFAKLTGCYKTQGRVTVGDSWLDMDTSGSGFEFYFNGSGDVSLGADVKCSYTGNMFLTVIVDGVKSRVEVAVTDNQKAYYVSIPLASGLADGVHHIEVYKQTEASSAIMTAWGVTFTGTPMAVPAKDKMIIEVIGDSISGGASNMATNSTANASYPVYQDGTATYAYLAAEALSAELRVVQTSGWGLVDGYGSGAANNLQDQYLYTSWWRDHTDTGLYDFATPADIVIINLGTNDGSKGTVTNAEFKAGALNLIDMIKANNPDAQVVMCTGMMGKYFESVMTETVAELGGADAGYFFCALPQGQSGGEAHPNLAEHAAAAETLRAFLLENCLPADYMIDFATTANLEATLAQAQAVTTPGASLTEAIYWAQIELDCGTTDGYRLGLRAKALEDAMNGYVTALDLMPVEGVTQTPVSTDGNGVEHRIYPYWNDLGEVSLYKGGEGHYWPYIHTDYEQLVNVYATPYLTIEVQSTSDWNLHLAYIDKDGNSHTVTAASVANIGTTDFPVQTERKTFTINLGAYISAQGHADSYGRVTVVGCDIYVIGATDTGVNLYTCAITDNDGVYRPTEISGTYAVESGVLCEVIEGTTAADLVAAMNDSEYLQVVDENGGSVSGAVATGMLLQLVVEETVVDEVAIAVRGDVDCDGAMTTVDARLILMAALEQEIWSGAKLQAGDVNNDAELTTSDVRDILVSLTE